MYFERSISASNATSAAVAEKGGDMELCDGGAGAAATGFDAAADI
jgi:hypothetical protein